MRLLLQCMDENKAPTTGQRNTECAEWLEDYNECLHHEKAVSGCGPGQDVAGNSLPKA